MTRLVLLAAFCLLAACRTVRESLPPMNFGFEGQVYPAGAIAGLRAEAEVGELDSFSFRAAANFTDRRDWGENDDESGSGYGGGFGWRRWLESRGDGWFAGARVDLWRLEIDWENYMPFRSGNSNVTVLMPTFEGGYSWQVGGGARLDLSLAAGAEFNVDTDGLDVGEGAILLAGVSILGPAGPKHDFTRRRSRPGGEAEPPPAGDVSAGDATPPSDAPVPAVPAENPTGVN